MEIKIEADDVERLVKDSLVKAGLGKTISEAVSKAFSGYDNPVEREIKKYVAEIASTLIRERFTVQIKESVALEVENRVTGELINKTVKEAMKRIERAAEDRL
jgi:hypothetical protein